jgi:hypothetical protein
MAPEAKTYDTNTRSEFRAIPSTSDDIPSIAISTVTAWRQFLTSLFLQNQSAAVGSSESDVSPLYTSILYPQFMRWWGCNTAWNGGDCKAASDDSSSCIGLSLEIVKRWGMQQQIYGGVVLSGGFHYLPPRPQFTVRLYIINYTTTNGWLTSEKNRNKLPSNTATIELVLMTSN